MILNDKLFLVTRNKPQFWSHTAQPIAANEERDVQEADSKTPWQAMVFWLKYICKLANSLLYNYYGLVNLYTT